MSWLKNGFFSSSGAAEDARRARRTDIRQWLPIEVPDMNAFTSTEGRILVHGQDEQTGRSYLMLEGTDAKVHYIEYTPEMELLRAEGGLRPNYFPSQNRRF